MVKNKDFTITLKTAEGGLVLSRAHTTGRLLNGEANQ